MNDKTTSKEKKKFTYYPGCSALGSASHLDTSLRAIAPELGLELEELDDWNCCGASVGQVEGGYLPNMVLSGRNLAKAAKQGKQDIITGCAACYINTHAANEKIKSDVKMRRNVNEALGAADLSYDEDLVVRHACEVIVNDVGIDKIKERVTKPLNGLKVAGYVGCQTVRPFANTDAGGKYDTYNDPKFLDDFTEAVGAEAVDFEVKTDCCGGAISAMSPDKTLPPDQEDPRRRRQGGRRRHRDALPAVSAERRDVPGRGQQEVRHPPQHPGGLLQPADGGRLWHGRQEGRRPRRQRHRRHQAGTARQAGVHVTRPARAGATRTDPARRSPGRVFHQHVGWGGRQSTTGMKGFFDNRHSSFSAS